MVQHVHVQLNQAAQKNKKHKRSKCFFVCKRILTVRYKKCSTNKDQYRKNIRKQSHNPERCLTDRSTDHSTHAKITDDQYDRSRQNCQQNDLCLESAGNSLLFHLFSGLFFSRIFTSGSGFYGSSSVTLFLCCCHSGTPPNDSS